MCFIDNTRGCSEAHPKYGLSELLRAELTVITSGTRDGVRGSEKPHVT